MGRDKKYNQLVKEKVCRKEYTVLMQKNSVYFSLYIAVNNYTGWYFVSNKVKRKALVIMLVGHLKKEMRKHKWMKKYTIRIASKKLKE